MISSSLTAILLLLPLIAAQDPPVDSSTIEGSFETYSLGPEISYTEVPGPSYTGAPGPTDATITYEEQITVTYSGVPPVITNPACNPEEEDCEPCVHGDDDCPYLITSPVTSPPVPTPSTPSTCICFSAPCAPCNGTPLPYPQTVYTTILRTITSCAPEVTSCPGRVSTSLISLSTIASPVVVVYTTAYVDVCPTGITTKTYTITRTCTEEKCVAPTAMPEHFTTTTKVCEACPEKPTLTVTCPVETATGTWANGTATAAGTGKPGCGSGGLCPTGTGNGTGHVETGGAVKGFVGGITVFAAGGLFGLLSFML